MRPFWPFFRRTAFFGLATGLAWAQSVSVAAPGDYQKLADIVRAIAAGKQGARVSAEEVLAALPDSLKKNFALVFRSKSQHSGEVTFQSPRVVLSSDNGDFLVAFTDNGNQIEAIDYNARNGYQTHVINLTDTSFHDRPQVCESCHLEADDPKGIGPRELAPILETYPMWDGWYGSYHRGPRDDPRVEATSPEEAKQWRTFLDTRSSTGVYAALGIPKDTTLAEMALRNMKIGLLLDQTNAPRVANKLMALPEAMRPALTAALRLQQTGKDFYYRQALGPDYQSKLGAAYRELAARIQAYHQDKIRRTRRYAGDSAREMLQSPQRTRLDSNVYDLQRLAPLYAILKESGHQGLFDQMATTHDRDSGSVLDGVETMTPFSAAFNGVLKERYPSLKLNDGTGWGPYPNAYGRVGLKIPVPYNNEDGDDADRIFLSQHPEIEALCSALISADPEKVAQAAARVQDWTLPLSVEEIVAANLNKLPAASQSDALRAILETYSDYFSETKPFREMGMALSNAKQNLDSSLLAHFMKDPKSAERLGLAGSPEMQKTFDSIVDQAQTPLSDREALRESLLSSSDPWVSKSSALRLRGMAIQLDPSVSEKVDRILAATPATCLSGALKAQAL